MNENFVTKAEFEDLKKQVDKLESNMSEIEHLFQAIDKKIDVISEKINSGTNVTDLKIKPIEKRVFDLEESHKWVIRAIIGEVIAIVCAFIFK
jgi:predicted  nucleic acid-binding Zn-ribbon protein